MVDVASSLGLGRGRRTRPGHLIALAELLLIRLPLPRRLDQIDGLRHEQIPGYARLALLDHCHRTNPRPCTQADLEDLLDRA